MNACLRVMMVAASLGMAVSICATPGVARAAGDPFVGKWVMDPQRSRYESGELPQRMVIVMSAAEQGIHYRSEATLNGGRIVSTEYTADYAGTLAVVVGTASLMAPISLRQVDDRTVDCSYLRGPKVVATSRRVVSADGTTMTITTLDGAAGTNVAVFTKEP